MAFESRRSLLAKVHIAAKALGLEDDAYRDMLEGLTGQRSAGKLTDKQLVLVITALRKKGWVDEDPRPARPNKDKPTPRATPGTAPLLEKIGALLADAGRPWPCAAHGIRPFAGSTTGIQTMSGNEAVQRLARTHRLSDRRVFDILKREPVTTVNVGGAVQLKLLG